MQPHAAFAHGTRELFAMFQFNQSGRFLSGFILFTITLFEAAGIAESRFGFEVDNLWLIALIALVFFGRIALLYAAQMRKGTADEPHQKEEKQSRIQQYARPLNIALMLGLVVLVAFYYNKGQGSGAILEDLLPQMEAAIEEGDVFTVYSMATDLLEETGNPLFETYLSKVTSEGNIYTNRDGVETAFRFRWDTTDTWFSLGKTPIEGAKIPYASLELKFTEGEEEFRSRTHPYYILEGSNKFILPPAGREKVEGEFLLKIGEKSRLSFPGLDHFDHVEYAPFQIAKHEVTNGAYLEFVMDDGYADHDHWDCPTTIDGVEYQCDELIAMFQDKTGRRGPANWEYSKPPQGQEEFPVTGISWFEARAFAHFKGMALPTVHQWAKAASLSSSSLFVPNSNFSKNQLQNVGDSATINPQGIFDIAGNAREWTHNGAGGDDKALLGGCYLDDDYVFNDYYSQPASDRSIANGMRLVHNLDDTKHYAKAYEPVFVEERDFLSLPGVSDDVFAIYRAQFEGYNHTLSSSVETVPLPAAGSVVVERVEMTDIGDDPEEILPAYIFYDSNLPRPYKPIIFFPGSNAIHMTNTNQMIRSNVDYFDYLLANGYAVVQPIYTSTYEKEDHLKSDYPVATKDYTEHVIAWGQEYKKAIDYIEQRQDFDAKQLSYFGVSWGGYMANILLAIDDRVKAAVLKVAGLCFQPAEQSVESYIYTPRIKCPTIMLNGKYDVFFPLETSQIPMFTLMGTPEEDKKHYVYASGHYVPRQKMIEEHLAWLELYLQ